jgi:OOP family OmpA-OmpF porin
MKKYPTTSAVIEGYADEVGSEDYNMALSQRRA